MHSETCVSAVSAFRSIEIYRAESGGPNRCSTLGSPTVCAWVTQRFVRCSIVVERAQPVIAVERERTKEFAPTYGNGIEFISQFAAQYLGSTAVAVQTIQ
jgi:hypothetical protein